MLDQGIQVAVTPPTDPAEAGAAVPAEVILPEVEAAVLAEAPEAEVAIPLDHGALVLPAAPEFLQAVDLEVQAPVAKAAVPDQEVAVEESRFPTLCHLTKSER